MGKQELIEKRRSHLNYDEAEKIQKQLIEIYEKEYTPKHSSAFYYKLIINNKVGEIKERHPQETNWPETVFQCFSVISQHVRGFTKEHCLDQIHDIIVKNKKYLKYVVTLPTLKELVNSNKKINPLKKYNYKSEYEEGQSGSYSGDLIIEMRETGLDNWRAKQYDLHTPEWRKEAERRLVFGDK